MKRPSLFTNHGLDQPFVARSLKILVMTFSLAATFAGCSDDDETSRYIGTYAVHDEQENYSIGIRKSNSGYEITNFGDVMNVPVKVETKGKTFSVPAQTFVGKSMTIVVSGHGVFDDHGGLQFDYSIDTGDAIVLEYTCSATKQP